MSVKKITKAINKELEMARLTGFEEGYEAGETTGYEDGWSEGHDEGYLEGIQAEKDRWKAILQWNFEYCMEANQGSKAVFFKNVMDILSIQIDMEEAKKNYDRDMESF